MSDSSDSENVVPISSAKPNTDAATGTASPGRSSNVLHAWNTLSDRLAQIDGSLIAIANTYDDERNEYRIPDEHLRNALWAVRELRDQADEAFEVIAKADTAYRIRQ